MADLFQPAAFARSAAAKDVVRLSWHLAGLTTVADWIGSRQTWFPYADAQDVADLGRYWRDCALPRAALAVQAAGLATLRPAPYGGLRSLFPGIAHASPVQAWAEQVALPEGPVLAVIEDLTGSGKTEAAVTLAHRLIADGRANGIFLALPTMATANAMFGRLASAYRGLFDTAANPSLVLAHGRAVLDPRFAAAIAVDGPPATMPAPRDPADEPAEAHCAAWLAEDRRRALLAQVGVGTLDQALLAALPVRHAPLRLWGLAGKVLVIDEAHAFDAYMQREMIALLRFHAALGGSAILLSATLPRAVRQGLADAFRDGLGHSETALTQTQYPLATLVAAAATSETPCGVREGVARRVTVTRLEDSEAAIDRIEAAAATGAAVAWVRNTVDDAIAATAALRARGIDALLFHARFAMEDRLVIEREVLRRFGRAEAGADRAGVLVATQVIEQSLDLDFDLMCTDLAPADLLIQRAGRLWRHQRTGRPIGAPELLVVSPEAIADPGPDWLRSALPGTAAVYRDPALLWRSARAVFGRGAIVTPDDMRPLIETAFDSEADGAVPPGLAKAAAQAEGKRLGQQGVAEQNTLDVWAGYRASAGLWDTDLRTPTRLEDQPQVTLRMAVVRDGAVVPYVDDPDLRRAWSLSEVRIAQHRPDWKPPWLLRGHNGAGGSATRIRARLSFLSGLARRTSSWQ
jgi:CRISPR-associated endonuclease/helicase Cas3